MVIIKDTQDTLISVYTETRTCTHTTLVNTQKRAGGVKGTETHTSQSESERACG